MAINSSFRLVSAGKNFLSPTDFIIQVDTSAGAVEIVMPKIATILSSYTTIYQYMGIRFIDISNNASTNNITLTGFETDTINDVTNIVLNTNGVGGILTLIGETDWSYQKNSTGGGSSTTPTLQQVLDFNHDLSNGNNFQGTNAGLLNTGTNVIAIGSQSAYCNTGNSVNAIGTQSAQCNSNINITAIGSQSAYKNSGCNVNALGNGSAFLNSGNNVNAFGCYSAFCNTGCNVNGLGLASAQCNTGSDVNAMGNNSAFRNTGNNLIAIGNCSAFSNTGVNVTAIGRQSAYCNTGSELIAIGTCSAYLNTGCNVIALGYRGGWNGVNGNGISGAVILSNSNLPTYTNYASASASITIGAGGVSDNTYLFYNQATCSIGAVRL